MELENYRKYSKMARGLEKADPVSYTHLTLPTT